MLWKGLLGDILLYHPVPWLLYILRPLEHNSPLGTGGGTALEGPPLAIGNLWLSESHLSLAMLSFGVRLSPIDGSTPNVKMGSTHETQWMIWKSRRGHEVGRRACWEGSLAVVGGQGMERVKCTLHSLKRKGKGKVRVWLSGRVIAEFVWANTQDSNHNLPIKKSPLSLTGRIGL